MAAVGPTLQKIFKAISDPNTGVATTASLTKAARAAMIDPAYVSSAVQKITEKFGKSEISLDDFAGKASELLLEHVQNPTKANLLAKAQEDFQQMDTDGSPGLSGEELRAGLFAKLEGHENQEIRSNAGAKLGMYLVDKIGNNGDKTISASEFDALAREIADTLL